MLSFKDRSFCASPNCKNECGRKLTPELMREYEIANLPENWNGILGICYGYFCGELKNDHDIQINQHEADIQINQHEADIQINQHEADFDRCEHKRPCIGDAGKYSGIVKCIKCGEFYK